MLFTSFLTFASSGVTAFYNMGGGRGSPHPPTTTTAPLQTAERGAVMWLMEVARVKGGVIFPMARDVFIGSEIQGSQSNSIILPHTLWSSQRVRGLISVTNPVVPRPNQPLGRQSSWATCRLVSYSEVPRRTPGTVDNLSLQFLIRARLNVIFLTDSTTKLAEKLLQKN